MDAELRGKLIQFLYDNGYSHSANSVFSDTSIENGRPFHKMEFTKNGESIYVLEPEKEDGKDKS